MAGWITEIDLMKEVNKEAQSTDPQKKLDQEAVAEISDFAQLADDNCDGYIDNSEYVSNHGLLANQKAQGYIDQFFGDSEQYTELRKKGVVVLPRVKVPTYHCLARSSTALSIVEVSKSVEQLLSALKIARLTGAFPHEVSSALGRRVQNAINDMKQVGSLAKQADGELLRYFDLEYDIARAAVVEMEFASEEGRARVLNTVQAIYEMNRLLITSDLSQQTEELKAENARLKRMLEKLDADSANLGKLFDTLTKEIPQK